MRAVLEAAGVKNILSKSLGSNNQLSVVSATMNGLLQLRTPQIISNVRGERVTGPAYMEPVVPVTTSIPEPTESPA